MSAGPVLLIVYVALIFRYMVDAADREKVEASRNELHNLLDKPQLQGIPVSLPVEPVAYQNICVISLQVMLKPNDVVSFSVYLPFRFQL